MPLEFKDSFSFLFVTQMTNKPETMAKQMYVEAVYDTQGLVVLL